MTAIIQNEGRWDVTGTIVVDNANTLLKLSKALTLADNAVVDFAQVTEVDTAAISLMLEWKRRSAAERKQIKFLNLPKNLTSLTDLYDVTDLVN